MGGTNLVSVVIPCFNSGKTIKQTIFSVKAQTYRNIEIIVVDDGSDDPMTIELLDGLDGVTLLRQQNLGLPVARNEGFRAAKGEYVMPLDADDWLEPNAIACMLNALSIPPHPSYVYCDSVLEGERSGVLSAEFNYFEQLSLNLVPYCILVSKKLWVDAGGYDETMCDGYEDWEFNIRLGTLGRYGQRVPLPLFHYRISSNGMLVSKSNRLHGRLWSQIKQRHPAYYTPISLLKQWWYWINKPSRYPIFLYLFWNALHEIIPNKAFTWIFMRIRRHPFN